MKKPITITVLILAVAGGIFCFRGCHSGPSPETVAALARADKADSALVRLKADVLPQIVRLQHDTAEKNRRFDSLRLADSIVRADLLTGIATVKNTLTGGDIAAARHDTAAILINWDSLRAQVKAGLPIVVKHDSLDEEEIKACIAVGEVKDSIASMWKRLYYAADTTSSLQKRAFTSLHRDFDNQQFQLKIWKPVAIGAGGILILNVLINSLKR